MLILIFLLLLPVKFTGWIRKKENKFYTNFIAIDERAFICSSLENRHDGCQIMKDNIKNNLEFSKSICEKLEPIIAPVTSHLGVTTFGYRKFFVDGRSFLLSNNYSWNNFFLEKFDKKIIPSYESEVNSVVNENKMHCVRVGQPDQRDLFLNALYDFNIWNTCSFYRKCGDGIEGFHFASTRDNMSVVKEYSNNRSIFERFSYYFKNKLNDVMNAENLMKAASPIISPEIFKTPQNGHSQEEQSITDFLTMTPINKFFFNVNGEETILSFQEFRSLALLSQGKTAKEIGRILKLSPRTVEDYIEKIKHKVKVTSRSHLIDVFFQNFQKNQHLLKYLVRIEEGV